VNNNLAGSKLEIDSSIYLTKDINPGSTQKIMDAIAKSAYNYNRSYEGCTRCVVQALNDHLHLTTDEGNRECIRASTALAAGVARMGETCGALTGAVMVLGLAFASADFGKFGQYVETMNISQDLFKQFRAIYGTVKCTEIQEKVLGRRYNFDDEKDREAWYKDGGLDRCPMVCAMAARIAAEIILKNRIKRDY
jgi:C_GCAxxG_C_C family probable redox protein